MFVHKIFAGEIDNSIGVQNNLQRNQVSLMFVQSCGGGQLTLGCQTHYQTSNFATAPYGKTSKIEYYSANGHF